MQILIIVAVIVVAGVVAYLAWLAEKRRREALSALAGKLGWTFYHHTDRSHDGEYAHFEIFRRGHSRAAYNTLRGELEMPGGPARAKAGDFRYKVTRHTGKSTQTTTYRFSYLIVELPWHGLPDLLIRRENVLDKIAGAFGFDDIDFESSEFSREYCVKSPDKRYAYDVIHPRMMEYLLAYEVPCVDMEHGRLCISDGSRKWEPAQFEAYMAWTRKFLAQWPDHVLDRLTT